MNTKQQHKRWRKEFNRVVFERDNNKCRICDETSNLDSHHITDRHLMPNGGYVLSNGISLCSMCHYKAEEYHITNGHTWPEGFHPNDLYDLIVSSYNRAYEDSLMLK